MASYVFAGKDSKPKTDTFMKRIIKDVTFRRKIVSSLALYGLFASLGWNVSQLGPSLLDLQLLTQTRLDEISYIFVAFSIGFVIGVILAPLLLKKAGIIKILITVHIIIALATAVTPWCKWFWVMVVVLTIRGICHGINNTGCNVLILNLWGKDNGPYMQTLHLSFAFGALISPLAMAPFFNNTFEKGNFNESSNCTGRPFSDFRYNTSFVVNCIGRKKDESSIHCAFVISAVIVLLSVVPFFYILLSRDTSLTERQTSDQRLKFEITQCKKTGTIVAIGSTFCLTMIFEKSIVFFLPTFLVQHLHWQKVQGSYAMSVFWGAFSIGRVLGVFVTQRFKMRHILGVYLLLLIIISVALLITNLYKASIGIWICVPCIGVFQSIVLPSLLTWTEVDFFKCSRRLVSLFMICKSVGAMCSPIALGYLIDLYSPMWFSYTLVTISSVMYTLYLYLLCTARNFIHKETEVSIYTDTEC